MKLLPWPQKLLPPIPIPSSSLPLRRPDGPTSSFPLRTAVRPLRAAADGPSPVEMVQSRDGVWSSASEKPAGADKKVVILWDLDNKPPRGPPYEAAVALRRLAALFGRVVDVAAYANRHAFLHLPGWVLEQRRQQRTTDELERRGLAVPAEPYVCSVCGRKLRTHADLRKHFRQLHERERNKKVARMKSLKGKKRRNFRERFIEGNFKYEEAARELIKPRTGYGLAAELRRAGVFVKVVADKPQAADAALKRQVQHSMERGIDWIFLVSDDSDFSEMLRRARAADLRTVVVGDWKTALGRQADLWFPWAGVENGEVGEELALRGRPLVDGDMEVSFASSNGSDDMAWSEIGSVVDEIVASAFSDEDDEEDGRRGFVFDDEDDSEWDSNDEEDEFL